MVVVLIGVSGNRRRRLESVGLPVPPPVTLRAQIDTGSSITGMMGVFTALEIPWFKHGAVRTPSTTPDKPHECAFYNVCLSIVSGLKQHTFESVEVIACDDFHHEEEVQGIIGRDVLDHCVFQYFGPTQQFELFF
jgi:hypothetical protein